jgi:alpha-1,3-rhamnosyl/mannosyltransferase
VRYTFNLARALASISPEDEFVLLYDPHAPNAHHNLAELQRYPHLRLLLGTAPLFSLSEQWRIPRQLGQLAPDVIHAPYYIRPYAMPAPVVFVAYDLIPLKYPLYFGLRERLIFPLTMGLSLRTAQVVISTSRSTATDLERLCGVCPGQITVVPGAADPGFAPQPAAVVATLRARYQLPERYALYLGSNKPHKNLVHLVESWEQVSGRVPGAKLVIAGHWDSRYEQAKERAKELNLDGQVRFAGPIADTDLPALYSGAEVFVFPSLYEGFGLPVLEAMACGTPVVCSNSSSLPEVAGDAALLAEPSDVGALSAAVTRALADESLRQEMREKGLARAAGFSWERTARDMLAVYHRLA